MKIRIAKKIYKFSMKTTRDDKSVYKIYGLNRVLKANRVLLRYYKGLFYNNVKRYCKKHKMKFNYEFD